MVCNDAVQRVSTLRGAQEAREKKKKKKKKKKARPKSNNMERLGPYVDFGDGFSGAPSYTSEAEYFAYDEENHGPKHLNDEWLPLEFKCLEYYDQDNSPPPHRA